MAWSRQGTGRPFAANSSSADNLAGLKLKNDPTLPATHQAVQTPDGKRVGVVKKVGAKFTGSHDNHTQKFDSPHAAVRALAFAKKLGAKKDNAASAK
jgi:hypothetical protein